MEFRCFAATTDNAEIGALSVLTLVLVAAGRKSITAWKPGPVELTGEKALHNLLKVRPVFDIVGSATLAAYRRQILKAAFDKALQYDRLEAARRNTQSPNAVVA